MLTSIESFVARQESFGVVISVKYRLIFIYQITSN